MHSLLSFETFEDLQHTYSWMKYYNTELEVGNNDEGVLKDLLTDVVKSICQLLKKLRETKMQRPNMTANSHCTHIIYH
jgi:hypothetical protein